ncbi:DUF2254 family protein [Alicyclobacillus sp. SO9]|uniref:DUF2254 family protein n=1 Tax=Alicyclobacillus sp. SO9 TaxID=2665646 RepID=UPI0018E6F75F|nr:DUF2254 family protein [Alicyclobacillus sp. SO9]QQE80728.1 DUF2254 domain-containing protein [Alicyclobacillus sp. SO9]
MGENQGNVTKNEGGLRRLNASWSFHAILAVLIIILAFSHPPMLFYGDTDTARNYLNTIVSSLSTILALCISVILVAIQLAASNYTHRVLDFYIRLPYNASLFLLYLVTILHSFYLMAKIRDPVREPLQVALRQEMSADLVLVMICFISLLLYMYAVVTLLKPDRIIHLIYRDYHIASRRKHWQKAQANVEQLCDIAKRAASVSDSVTGTLCMRVMLDIGKDLPLPENEQDKLLRVHQNLIDQWIEMVGVCAKEKETGLMKTVLDGLYEQGQYYIQKEFWTAAVVVIRAYRHIVFSHLLEEGQYYYVETVAVRLYALADEATAYGERGQLFTLRTWKVICAIGEHIFASSPETEVTFLQGFLLSRHVFTTLNELPEDLRIEGLSLYFQLWKAFAVSAQMREAARFATWWKEQFHGRRVFHQGQQLALQLCRHLGREEIEKTLCHVWELEEIELQPLPEFNKFRLALFDGWPKDTFAKG